jgi:hypothetical protein
MKHLLLLLLLLGGTFRLSAQTPDEVHILIGLENAHTADTVCVPLIAVNFTDVIGLQWVINWHTNQLQFVNVQDFGLPGMSNQHFGFNPSAPNRLVVAWSDNFANLVTVPDGTTLYSICFNVLAPANTTCPVTPGTVLIPNSPIGIFGINDQEQEVNYYNLGTIVPGYVYVEGSSATQEATTSALRLAPNPTAGPLTLTNLPADHWHYQLSDATGRLVLTGPLTGNSLDFSGQQPGLYLLSLRSETAQLRPVPVVVSR